MSVSWDYYEQFEEIENKYLPARGEGRTMATQIVTAVSKLVYKWYNDGDVFDNTHNLEGWANDLSSFANWLYKNCNLGYILDEIEVITSEGEYEDLLKELTDVTHDEKYLEEMNQKETVGSIYECDGPYKFTDDEYEDIEW